MTQIWDIKVNNKLNYFIIILSHPKPDKSKHFKIQLNIVIIKSVPIYCFSSAYLTNILPDLMISVILIEEYTFGYMSSL